MSDRIDEILEYTAHCIDALELSLGATDDARDDFERAWISDFGVAMANGRVALERIQQRRGR